MYLPIFNLLPLLFTLSTAFGVLVHDTQLDRATATALSAPVAIINVAAADSSLKSSDLHVHSERASFSRSISELDGSQPRTQTRNGDDKKYVVQKKLSSSSTDSEYSWPSI